ncbi:MAG: hypothetical protein GKR92_05565 [Gammaproteobacteria bacterium]|nr:MAG: hypothetical protein GKR92_05565 [Gammaproteobacteria bacterium]
MAKKEEIHQCSQNKYKDVEIRYGKINKEQWSWIIETTWYATESEVEDGLAREVRIPLHSDTLLINFCPFCGVNFSDKRKKLGK